MRGEGGNEEKRWNDFSFTLPTLSLNLLDSDFKRNVYRDQNHLEFQTRGLLLCLQIPQRTRTSTINLSRTARDCFEYNLRASRRGPLGWHAGALGGRDGSVTDQVLLTWWVWWSGWRTTKCSLCDSSEQKGQRAAGAWGFSPLLQQTRWLLAPPPCVWESPPPPPPGDSAQNGLLAKGLSGRKRG